MNKFGKSQKRKIAVMLLLSMLLANIQPLVASAKAPFVESTDNMDTVTYYDVNGDCEVKITYINDEIESQNEVSEAREGYYEVYENDIFSYSMKINVDENIIEFQYANGENQIEPLSNYIVFTDEILTEEEPIIEEKIISFI